MSESKNHILVIRLSAMGDVAMTVPVLRALSTQHPQVKVTVLTREFFKPFFRDLSNVTVFSIDVNGKHKGLLGLYKLSKELKKHNIHAVADLHNVLRTKILKFFFFGKQFAQIDKGRKEKRALITGESFQQLKTTHQRYADVFEKLGFKLDLKKPTFPEKRKLHENILLEIGNQSEKWIGIAPFATYISKMYPLDSMQKVVESLSKEYKIFLFGSKEENKKLAPLCLNNNVINLAGKLTLQDELDIISNLNVMLSMDSGNAHIAAMLGKKVITLWGVTHPFAGFMPFNQPKDYMLLANREDFPLIPTSIYGNKFPETYANAAGSIPVQKIIDKIKSVI